jgi:hypothetical protein
MIMHQAKDLNWWWKAFERYAARRFGTNKASYIWRYEQEPGSGITHVILVLLRDIKAYDETSRFLLVPDFGLGNFFKEDEDGITRDEFIALIKEKLREIIEGQAKKRIERHASE